MQYPIAIEMGDSEHAYGVMFPDIPKCFSGGDTLEEALTNAEEALNLYLEDLAERGQMPPTAKELSHWQSMEEYQGFSWHVISVNTSQSNKTEC
ncbi:type II toxin-antitoxin system HicB family antitoxin [Vibrio sp. Hal054]|uniref:type II toxin-antitoxin system HicB family antitoxin n=1 Tax=Vibrio sp. Hal054 TaxID=3035158 RepID=UPI00301CEDEA